MALKDHILKLADGVSKCQENAKSLAQVIFRGLDDIADNLPEHPGGGSDVSVTQVLSSGTKTATITVDNVDTDLYAPDPTDVDVTQVLSSGTKIATVTVDDVPTDIYAPTPSQPTDVDVTQVVSTGTKIATIAVDDVPTDIYAPSASGGMFIDTSTVVKDDFTLDAQFHTWEATANCVLTGNCDAPDSSTAWVIQINDNQVGAGYQVMCPFIYVKAGQTVKYRLKSTSALKAYALQS